MDIYVFLQVVFAPATPAQNVVSLAVKVVAAGVVLVSVFCFLAPAICGMTKKDSGISGQRNSWRF